MWKWQSVALGGALVFGGSVPTDQRTSVCCWALAWASEAPTAARLKAVRSRPRRSGVAFIVSSCWRDSAAGRLQHLGEPDTTVSLSPHHGLRGGQCIEHCFLRPFRGSLEQPVDARLGQHAVFEQILLG